MVSISLSRDALDKINARAKNLGLSRSAYLSLMAHFDVSKTLAPTAALPASAPAIAPLDLTAEVYDFLLTAVPALQEYEAARARGEKPSGVSTVEMPPDMAESKLWRFFLLEMDEILRHKYLRSKEEGEDIGLQRAVKEWLQMHRALWAAANPVED